LFPEAQDPTFQEMFTLGRGTCDMNISQRSGKVITATITLTTLGPMGQWGLLTFEHKSLIQQKETEQELQKQRWEALQLLTQAYQRPDIKSAYQQILQAGQLLTGAGLLAIYTKTEKDTLTCTGIWGTGHDVLGAVKIKELAALQIPHIWTPGKRTPSSFHRIALAEKFNYMATSPINPKRPQDGILVATDQIGSPPNDILSFLDIISAVILFTTLYHKARYLSQQSASQIGPAAGVGDIILDNINDSIIFASPDLTIMDLNSTAETTLGYSLDEVRGQPVHNIVVGANSLLSALNSVQSNMGPQFPGTLKLHRRDGRPLLAHVRVIPIAPGGKLEKIAILITDLSEHEQFRLRAQQLEQQALLGEVTAIFAHEVRNPINNISTGLQLMTLDLPADDPQREKIARMQDDCDRLTHLMKSVLSFSGTREYKMNPIDLGPFLQRILEGFHPQLTQEHIQSNIHQAANVPHVIGDRRALEQVFTNLISNAIHAMKNQGGNLSIKIEPGDPSTDPNMVVVNVSDTGPGIPANILQRIFQPFFTTHEQGTGLGLTITRRIVMAHNGRLDVNSFPGATIFQVKLPQAEQ
ncbi:MAG: ATP-binding protein, partial [Anaerolineae bacterium]|nr:ATP-binding protein [Anaerolineae bacterium]